MSEQNSGYRSRYTWEWPAVIGVALISLGVGVIGVPTLATFGIAWVMGLTFFFSGLAQVLHAFRFATADGSMSRFLVATLSVVAGVIVLRAPQIGAQGITIVLAFYLLFAGVAKAVLSIETRLDHGRGWLALSSIVSLALGIYVIATFDTLSEIIPGTILGVDLIIYGFSLTVISADIRGRGKSEIKPVLRKVA